MRSNHIGDGLDWNTIIQDTIKTIPTIFQRPATVNPYQTAPYSLPQTPTQQYGTSMYPAQTTPVAQPSTGLNMTTILLFGAAGLVAIKLLNKK